jgi:hypothetical protein
MRHGLFDLFRYLTGYLGAALPREEEIDVAAEPDELQRMPARAAATETVPVNEAETVTRVDVVETGRQWHDLRGEPRTKSRGKSKGHRDWSKVKGITIHQTAVDFGHNPRRLLNVPVHGATLTDGSIVLLHDPTSITWHAHGFNKHDLGIEVSCRAAGIEGNGSTLWLPKKYKGVKGDQRLAHATEATDEQLEATRELIRYYVDLVAKHGGKIEFVHAHRQSSKSRVSDPGSRIWQACGVWAIKELGLSAGPPGWSAGGYALPDAWTGEPNGVRYSSRVDGRLS